MTTAKLISAVNKGLFSLTAAFLSSVAVFAQAPEISAEWTAESRNIEKNIYEITLKGTIMEGWHIYGVKSEDNPTSFALAEGENAVLKGELQEVTKPTYENGVPVFYGKAVFSQRVEIKGKADKINCVVSWQACSAGACAMPEEYEFSVKLKPAEDVTQTISESHSTPIASNDVPEKTGNSIWALIIEAILWGFAMLLTPCVFPMVPMTISFFIKGSDNKAKGRFNAFMYGLFIVLLYTVPISVIIMLTKIIGGDAVTADIFNWLATHWFPNILFFVVFMIFAASFFGAFEITLPSSIVNKSDSKADKKGLIGVFFMALTLVLVSFSCTGPIVGTVLIKSTKGEFWAPMVTMLAFSTAFALPFTILALFPSILKNLPKSGAWLNSVKVILGFIEVALGLKFLSVADQTYHWGLLGREVYLAIWIATFTLLGFYLLGKLRFKHDDEVTHISVLRLTLAIGVFSFVVYLIPGMWGAPLKALSGYLPPIDSQDFIVGKGVTSAPGSPKTFSANKYGLTLPLGLSGYFNLEEGMAAGKSEKKPVFVDITGHGCVNCREMEQRVWSDPRVLEILQNEYVLVALYTDDKASLDKEDWITTPSGKVLKDLGRANSYIVRTRFGVNAQPNYVILSPDGKQLLPVRGYNLDIDGFIAFLKAGIEEYKKSLL